MYSVHNGTPSTHNQLIGKTSRYLTTLSTQLPPTFAQTFDDSGKDLTVPTQLHPRQQNTSSTPPPKYGKQSYVDLTHTSGRSTAIPNPTPITHLGRDSVNDASPKHNGHKTYHHTPRDSDRTQHPVLTYDRTPQSHSHTWTETTPSSSSTLDRILTQLSDAQLMQSSFTSRLRKVEKKLDRLIGLHSQAPPDYSSKIDSLSNFLLKLYESISRLEKDSSNLYNRHPHLPPR